MAAVSSPPKPRFPLHSGRAIALFDKHMKLVKTHAMA
jgi:hypothetical protein